MAFLRDSNTICSLYSAKNWHLHQHEASIHCIVFVFILRAISPCTTGLKALYDPFDCTSTVQLSIY